MNAVNIQTFLSETKNQKITILDIRDKEAYLESHFEGAISMPLTSVPNRLNELDLDTHYYILSHAGRRAQTIAHFLAKHGFQTTVVTGGMKALRTMSMAS
jgi:rhodanese-related sulfurtransferase